MPWTPATRAMPQTPGTSSTPPTFAGIEDAAHHIAGAAHRTPVATSHTLHTRSGAGLFFKCEKL